MSDGHEWEYEDLAYAITHAAPDDPEEDEEGFITWNGRSLNAMNTADERREESC